MSEQPVTRPAAAQAPIAIVTGGSRGLGRSTVINLAQRGVRSIFTYHSNRAEADKVVAQTAELGLPAVALQLDVGNSAGFDAFVGEVKAALAGLGRDQFDYLVNNAGTGCYAPFTEMGEAAMDQLYNVHFKGVYFLTQKLLPLLRDGGRIVNISSGLTRMTLPGSSAYAAMKAAVEVMTRYLAKELGPRRIAVNVVAPGAIETDFGNGRVRDDAEINRQVAAGTALGRVGLPEDIGPMIALLLAEENRWINGQRIEVSGGQML